MTLFLFLHEMLATLKESWCFYLSGSTEIKIIGQITEYFDIQLAGLMQGLLNIDIVLLLSLLRELPADRRFGFWGLSTYVTSFKKVMEKLPVLGVTELVPLWIGPTWGAIWIFGARIALFGEPLGRNFLITPVNKQATFGNLNTKMTFFSPDLTFIPLRWLY